MQLYGRITYGFSCSPARQGSSRHYRTPNNLTKGKSKLISIKTDKISQQQENCENRNDPDLVQAFLKKWWVEVTHLQDRGVTDITDGLLNYFC